MLDIVITHYKEPYEVGEKLLRMIGLQRGIDFSDIRVTVVNDGGNRLPDEKLADMGYPIEQLDIPHGGISAARNAGIDHATEPWIMFCDFDDNYTSIYSLEQIMNVLPKADMDMLWTKLLVDDTLTAKGRIYYSQPLQRFVFCHGKVYRTKFLRDSGIRFDESLSFNEDSLFNAVIIARTPYQRIGEIKGEFPIYTWIRRESSVTNSGRDDEAEYGHFRRNLTVTEENRLHREPECYPGMVTRTAYDVYYMTKGKRISNKMKRQILDEFVPWISERMDAFGVVDEDTLEQIRSVSKSELIDRDENVPDDYGTVSKWVLKMITAYGRG